MFKKRVGCVVITGLLLSFTANALTDLERVELARLQRELVQLDRIITLAKRAAHDKDRHRFNYASLENDLNVIKQGLSNSLNQIKRDPTLFKHVNGEY